MKEHTQKYKHELVFGRNFDHLRRQVGPGCRFLFRNWKLGVQIPKTVSFRGKLWWRGAVLGGAAEN